MITNLLLSTQNLNPGSVSPVHMCQKNFLMGHYAKKKKNDTILFCFQKIQSEMEIQDFPEIGKKFYFLSLCLSSV